MTAGLKLRTLRWDFAGSLEPPRVVSCRTEEALGKGNVFGQVTIRFHTQQVSSYQYYFIIYLICVRSLTKS